MPIFGVVWGRSRHGNLYCRLADGAVVTVFGRDGRYRWCIKRDGDDLPRYSRKSWDSESEAQQAVMAELAAADTEIPDLVCGDTDANASREKVRGKLP